MGSPHDNFGGGSSMWVVWTQTWLVKSRSFFSFFFGILHHAPRSHFSTDRDDLYVKTRVSSQGCAFWGSRQYLTTFRRSNHQKTFPKWAGIGIFKHKRQKWKSTYLENWSTDWQKISSASLDHQRGFVGGPVTLHYESKMVADAILNFL